MGTSAVEVVFCVLFITLHLSVENISKNFLLQLVSSWQFIYAYKSSLQCAVVINIWHVQFKQTCEVAMLQHNIFLGQLKKRSWVSLTWKSFHTLSLLKALKSQDLGIFQKHLHDWAWQFILQQLTKQSPLNVHLTSQFLRSPFKPTRTKSPESEGHFLAFTVWYNWANFICWWRLCNKIFEMLSQINSTFHLSPNYSLLSSSHLPASVLWTSLCQEHKTCGSLPHSLLIWKQGNYTSGSRERINNLITHIGHAWNRGLTLF